LDRRKSAITQETQIVIAPVMPTYARAPLQFERGEGSWLISAEGEKYLDFGAGIAVNCLGHAHPKLVEALETQARRVWHVSNLYEIPRQQELAEKLVAATFADTMFFCNSGAEAMELAIKMARKYWSASENETDRKRHRIITFDGAFHGRTLATISSAQTNPKLVDGFGPLLPGFDVVPFGDHEAVKAAIGPETAAIMIEPVQGEGGIRPVPHQCLRGLRELCDEHGILLIFDEIQCGVGRTGTLFAHEQAGITPDIMGVAKGIGGGFPLGACLATENAARGMVPGTHGSTYGGNPLGCAVGSAVLDELLAPGFLDEVKRKAGHLRQRLAELADTHSDLIAEVRGEGLMIGIRFHEGAPAGDMVGLAYDQHLLTVPAAENVMRILPPLNVSDDELSEAVSRIDAACQARKAA
jgi:acetylornithine/N-succinyldiaminopimelate aminotransferase